MSDRADWTATIQTLAAGDMSDLVDWTLAVTDAAGGGGGTGGTGFISASSAATSSGSPLAVPAPAGMAAGDLLVLVAQNNFNTATLTATGWSGSSGRAVGAGMTFAVLTKIAGASEPASYSLTVAAGGSLTDAAILAYAPAAAIDAGPVYGYAAASPLSVPSLTPTGPDRVWLLATHTANSVAPTVPAAWTSRAVVNVNLRLQVFDQLWAPTSATGATTITFPASGEGDGVAVLLA